jgi:hypothetical protein
MGRSWQLAELRQRGVDSLQQLVGGLTFSARPRLCKIPSRLVSPLPDRGQHAQVIIDASDVDPVLAKHRYLSRFLEKCPGSVRPGNHHADNGRQVPEQHA